MKRKRVKIIYDEQPSAKALAQRAKNKATERAIKLARMINGEPAFTKGGVKPEGSGRQKGSVNKLTRQAKEMLEAVGQQLGPEYFITQAWINPVAFMSLYGRLLPLSVTGKDDGPVQVEVFQSAEAIRAELRARGFPEPPSLKALPPPPPTATHDAPEKKQ